MLQISISNTCGTETKLQEKDRETPMMSDGGLEDNKNKNEQSVNTTADSGLNLAEDPNSCFFEGKFYANLQQWLPEFDKTCTSCKCSVSTCTNHNFGGLLLHHMK